MSDSQQNIIIYNTADGKASVKLYAQDGMVWMNQNPLAELFDTSKQNIGQHIANILSKDWGFYYTTTLSLEKIRKGLEVYRQPFSDQDVENIRTRIDTLSKMMEEAPKSLAWRARAQVGPRVKWYNDVDEVERAEHLGDL